MLKKKYIAALAVTGVALSGFSFASSATAFETVAQSYAVVGSDTLEDVVGYLTNNKTTTDQSEKLGNFDATGGATGAGSFIVTKAGGNMFPRPNGSGDGRNALMAAINGFRFKSGSASTGAVGETQANGYYVVAGNIDIVRSSSDGSTDGTDANNKMERFLFGRDAISYAYGSALTNASNIPATNLKKIFNCTTATLNSYGITTVVIPQSGSGTRKDFIAMLNLSTGSTTVSDSTINARLTTATAVGVSGDSNCITVGQEHDAASLSTTGIMPMAATRWIAMKNGMSPTRISAGTDLGSVLATDGTTITSDGTGTTAVPAYVTSGSTLLGNPAYYANADWGRDTYLFASRARIANETTLAKLFSYTDQTSLTYTGYTPSGPNPAANNANYTRLTASTNAATLFAAPSTAGTNLYYKMQFGFLPPVQDPTVRAYRK